MWIFGRLVRVGGRGLCFEGLVGYICVCWPGGGEVHLSICFESSSRIVYIVRRYASG